MSGEFTVSVDLSGLNEAMDALGEKAEAAARPGAQAMAQVFYDQVRANVSAIHSETGNLASSIYQVYSADNSSAGNAVYHISWNATKAPHGHLVEFGHIQRYQVYIGRDGHYYTKIRAGKKGSPKPSRRASQAAKDAYYVPLPGGPRQVMAQPFVRTAFVQAVVDRAAQAAEEKLATFITDDA